MRVDTRSKEYEAAFKIMVAKGKLQYLAGVEHFKSCIFSCEGVVQADILHIRITQKKHFRSMSVI